MWTSFVKTDSNAARDNWRVAECVERLARMGPASLRIDCGPNERNRAVTRTMPRDHEHALNARERIFQRRTVGQFRDRGFGIHVQHVARFVRIANNTNRISSERPKLLHYRAFGITCCSAIGIAVSSPLFYMQQ